MSESWRWQEQLFRATVRSCCCLVVLAALTFSAEGQTTTRSVLSRDYVSNVLNEAVNTNTLIASQDLISNGRFVQRNRGQPDTKYETFRLPAEVMFGEKTDTIRPFVRGGFGLLRVTGRVVPVEGDGDNDLSVSRLLALTTGGGVAIRLAEGLSISPAFLLTYTHMRNAYNFNNPFSQEVLREEYGDFYNWNLDLFTYIPSLRLRYERELATGRVRYTVSFSQLLNDSIHSTSSATTIDSASGLVANRVEFRQDLGVSVSDVSLGLQPFFQWSNISGKASSGLNFVNLFEVGADLISILKEPLWIFSEIYVGASYVSADNFEGYHIGLGGHL